MITEKLERLYPALRIIAERLGPVKALWLVGGSTGLLMHGVPLAADPRDLDLYADRESVPALHGALRSYATDVPHFSETGMYVSNLSHYRIDGVKVELVGGFEVRRDVSLYRVETAQIMAPHSLEFLIPHEADPIRIQVMPLAHELLFNVLRERPDRYEPIAAHMRHNLPAYLDAWTALVRRNRIAEPFLGIVRGLLPEWAEERSRRENAKPLGMEKQGEGDAPP
ncbi:hypothetical protein [Paenibacillus koleovorans]|uniref:hypothetical protein n=1 Tax=Paenibacillus koleovorans TaxID=121608 RepID=UPI000FD8C1D8|nr:hypothetical protein [Paenibacillus koleovorans]